jgi:hypothetical protein
MKLNGTKFINCRSKTEGGAMHANMFELGAKLELIDVTFENCNSTQSGGLGFELNLNTI